MSTVTRNIQHKQQQTLNTHNLSAFLANTYVLYLKTQNFHWNVTGPLFQTLHKLFEKQYEDLAEAVDTIAERLRALSTKAPGSMRDFLQLTSLKESSGQLTAEEMLAELVHDHKKISQELHGMISQATSTGDEGSADLMIQRLRVHDKAAWMLESHLQTH